MLMVLVGVWGGMVGKVYFLGILVLILLVVMLLVFL